MVNERTLVILKPDAVNRDFIGKIIARFEDKGLRIAGLKMEHLKPYKLEEHYAHHKGKAFYDGLVKYMSSVPCVLLVLEGKEAVKVVRNLVGATQSRDALPGTIRGDFSVSTQFNLVHASDSVETAKKEIARFFKSEELFEYKKISFEWLYSEDEKAKK